MSIDVTDATFPAEVLERSKQVPVVVDLWAAWCGPCKTLGPILEKVVDETDGKVVLAKVDVDDEPADAAAFQVQGIPAVYALQGRQGRRRLRRRPARGRRSGSSSPACCPTEAEDALAALLAAGDEASLRQALELEPGHERGGRGAGRAAGRAGRRRRQGRRSPCSSASPSRPRPAGSPRWPASARDTQGRRHRRARRRCSTG